MPAKRGSKKGEPNNTPPEGVAAPLRKGRRTGVHGVERKLVEDALKTGLECAWKAVEDTLKQGRPTDRFTVSRVMQRTLNDKRGCGAHVVRRGLDVVQLYLEQQPKDVDTVFFNSILDACCKVRDLPRLERTLTKMEELQVKPTAVTLGIIVKAYGKAGDLDSALRYWEEMGELRRKANDTTYGCVLDACVMNGNVPKAIEIFEGLKAEGKHRNVWFYSTLIKGHSKRFDFRSAYMLFNEMAEEGVGKNAVAWNSMIDVAVKCEHLSVAEDLFAKMSCGNSACKPDTITHSTMIKGYCNAGRMEQAFKVFEAMDTRSVRKDEQVYNTLMDGYLKAGDWMQCFEMFEEMLTKDLTPSAITHSILCRLAAQFGMEDSFLELAVDGMYRKHGKQRHAMSFPIEVKKTWVKPIGISQTLLEAAVDSPLGAVHGCSLGSVGVGGEGAHANISSSADAGHHGYPKPSLRNEVDNLATSSVPPKRVDLFATLVAEQQKPRQRLPSASPTRSVVGCDFRTPSPSPSPRARFSRCHVGGPPMPSSLGSPPCFSAMPSPILSKVPAGGCERHPPLQVQQPPRNIQQQWQHPLQWQQHQQQRLPVGQQSMQFTRAPQLPNLGQRDGSIALPYALQYAQPQQTGTQPFAVAVPFGGCMQPVQHQACLVPLASLQGIGFPQPFAILPLLGENRMERVTYD